MNEQQREKLETLDGSRGRNALRRAAVRIEDVDGLLLVTQKLKAQKAAGSSPTKAEFDALVDDVNTLHKQLVAVSSALQARLLG